MLFMRNVDNVKMIVSHCGAEFGSCRVHGKKQSLQSMLQLIPCHDQDLPANAIITSSMLVR